MKILFYEVFLVLLLAFQFTASGQNSEGKNGLAVRGKVLGIELTSTDKNYVDAKIKLSLDFVNVSNEPVIILKPDGTDYNQGDIFWQADVALAKTKEDAASRKYIQSFGMLPSIYPFPVYRQLAERLDKPTPPSEVTRTLQPNETWTWETTAFSRISRRQESYSDNIGWEEIRKLESPLWMRVTYSIFPSNINRFKKGLGKKLLHRWKSYGRLWFDSKSTHNEITSESFLFELNKTKVSGEN